MSDLKKQQPTLRMFLVFIFLSLCSFPVLGDNFSESDSAKLKKDMEKVFNDSKVFSGSERKKFKKFGLMPKCQKGFKLGIARCYKPCKEGFKGVGPLCWQKCKKGFRDLGLTCHKKSSFKNYYKKKRTKRKSEAPMNLGITRPRKIKYIRDQKGRALILRGVNSSNTSKKNKRYLPWITKKAVIQETRDFGFNGVRFLIFWAGIEPERDVYNDKYLDAVAKRVKWYTDNGAYVFLDMHQDIYGYGVRGGNGAPKWATESGIASKYKKANLTKLHPALKKMWWLNAANPAVVNAYDNFWRYTKHKYLQDHYVKAWQRVAKRFKNNPMVIGYDLMNEPHSGDISPFFEAKRLKDFYNRVIKGIRKIDKEKYLFIEPRSFGVNFGMPSFLPKIKDPRPGPARIVYAPHIYPLLIHEDIPYGAVDRRSVSRWSMNRTMEIKRLGGVPLIAGEIGGNDATHGFKNYLEETFNMLDYMGAGWTWYSNAPNNKVGKGWSIVTKNLEENPKVNLLVRTYPRAIAGDPKGFTYDMHTGDFQLRFKTKQGVKGPTEIFVPKRHYPKGFDVKVFHETESDWEKKWDDKRQILYITT
ncbi:MAG: cellulase family glycosylhydrolase, partial [Bdellovibrionota bacterium]|nr:cellulase family glycosylhydrolase [Bdellovibrionota bacterium]